MTDWDLTTASYVQTLDTSGKDNSNTDCFIKGDGTSIYVIGSGGDKVYQWNLSTPYDLSSASSIGEISVAAKELIPQALYFSDDGTHMYVGGANDDIYQYDLGTAWLVSTALYSKVYDASGEETDIKGVCFAKNGEKMYICGITGDDVNEYDINPAWDVSSATWVRVEDTSGVDNAPRGIAMSNDGVYMYICGDQYNRIWRWTLSTPYNISTATQDQNIATGVVAAPNGVSFDTNGQHFYVDDAAALTIRQFDIVPSPAPPAAPKKKFKGGGWLGEEKRKKKPKPKPKPELTPKQRVEKSWESNAIRRAVPKM